MKKKYPLTIILFLTLLALIIGVRFFNIHISIKEALFSLYLKTGKESIYEKNNNDYPKTKIDIPKHQGYLIAVYKDKHKLKLYKDNLIIKEYDVNIKRELVNRKIWEDDQTPEGVFKVETMDIVTNGWERWMRLDTLNVAVPNYIAAYPDAQQRINKFESENKSIKNDADLRKFNQNNPDQKILRGIGIHGGGFSLYHEWTNGCIAMSNQNIIELFNILSKSKQKGINIPVIIQD